MHGVRLACSLTYEGSYRQSADLQRQMRRWAAESGLSPVGPLREVYHRFGADQVGYRLPKHVLTTRTEGLVTELQMGVGPLDARAIESDD